MQSLGVSGKVIQKKELEYCHH